jgi:tetratricopeptide (TPR) repeat protein
VAAYDSLCEAYSRAGDYQKAVSVAEQLVELDPESSQHKDRLKFLKSKLGGPARAPEPAAKPAPLPPRPAAPPPKPPAPAPAPPPRVEARPAAPPRPAAPAPPPRPAPAPPPKAPISEISEIPDFGSFGDDLSQAVEGSFSDLSFDEPKAPAAAASFASIDLGDVVELTQEEEENIKEKLTEAEVFVRYGLVDKAIGQLVDVLESFRYHGETREKLIEIYKDQGMNREAGEQLMQLAQVYDRFGRSQEASSARQEAAQLNPALASRMAAPGPEVEEEPELILAPETESDLGDAGIEIDIASMEEDQPVFSGMGPQSEADIPISFDDARFDEPSIEVSLDEPAEAPSIEAPLSQEVPIEVDWGAAESDFGGTSESVSSEDSIDLTGAVDVEEDEISVSLDDELPEEVAFASPARGEEIRIESESEDIEINLDASSADIPISIEEPVEQPGFAAASGLDEEFEVEIEDKVPAHPLSPAFEEEFSVDLGEDEEPSVEIGVSLPESEAEETFSPSFGGASSDYESDFQIDIPSSADEMDLSDLSNLGIEDEEAIEIEEAPAPAPRRDVVVEPKRAAPPSPPAPAKAAPRPEPPPAPPPKAAPPPRPAPPPARSPVAAELDEVDEYIALGLYEDARDTLRELLKKHPGQSEILAKIEDLGFSSEQIQKEAKEPARLLKTPVAEAPQKRPAAAPAPPPPKAKEPEPRPSPVASPPSSDELEVEEFAEASLGDELESLVDLSEPEPAVAPRVMARPAPEADFIDLASELSEEIFGTHSAVEEEDAEPEGPLTDPGLDQIFREFRKGVEKQLGAEDYDTRYNLGIAYKEMGLLDEAIAEFQLAAKDEVRSLECCSMLGLCFMEKGMPDIAIKWFSKGLAIPGRREEEYHGLRYDLAQAYEAAGQPERALELYMEIFRENIKFRDVQERVKELQAARK